MGSPRMLPVLIAAALVIHAALACATVLTTDEQRLTWYLPVARAAWPGSLCAGQEQIVLHDTGEVRSSPGGAGALGAAFGACRVGIADGLSNYMFCAILTHELGHLAGQQHSPDPESIMSPVVPNDYAPCVVAQPLSVAEALDGAVPSLLGGRKILSERWVKNATVVLVTTRSRRGQLGHWRCQFDPYASCVTPWARFGSFYDPFARPS